MSTTNHTPTLPAIPPEAIVLQMLGGFQVSQTLYALAKLDVATMLSDGPKTIAELAEATGAGADSLGRVIRFAASLGLFRTDGGKVANTPLGEVLVEGHPNSLRWAAFYWMETHYGPFGDFLESVRTGDPASHKFYGKTFFEFIAESPERTEIQNRAFADVTRSLRSGMFDGYKLPEGALVADLGGADGSMLSQLLADEPDRRGIVFDLPEIVPAAQKTLENQGLSGRVQVQGGDFFESVPAADVYLLSYVLHDWDDDRCKQILAKVAQAGKKGARVVLAESVIPSEDVPHPSKAIDVIMLAMTQGGRERTADEWQSLLDSAGFSLDRIVESPTMFSFIEATLR